MTSAQISKVYTPRELNFVYGNDSRYWSIPQDGPARAVQVLLLSVSGVYTQAQAGKRYRVTFKVALKDDAFGWDGTPVLVAAKVGKTGKFTFRDVNLSGVSSSGETIPSEDNSLEITMTNGNEIHFGLYELSKKKWKGGLEIHSATVEEI